MLIWQILFGIVVLVSALYLGSYGFWLGKKKNWLGAVGVGIIILATLAMPFVAAFVELE